MTDLAGAAVAMGVPETLVKRSAEARAKATGASVDEILAAWAGGTPVPAATTAPAPQAASTEPAVGQTSDQPPTDESPATSSEPEPVGAAASPQPAFGDRLTPLRAAGPSAPPLLVGAREGIGLVMSGSLGLLILSLLLSVFLPSIQQPGNGIRASNHAFSSQALAGQHIYASQGCATCHTQMIRNVVTDVGLGPVTLDDTNQIIGYRRIGPDLAAIGSRTEGTAALTALLSGDGNHPAVSGLSESDLANLVAYLRESR